MSKEVDKQMVMQTLILSKETFPTKAEATRWVKEHDFVVKSGAPDETTDSWRFRQREPSEFQDGTLRTIDITDGVKGVVGRLKEEKMSEEQKTAKQRGDALLLALNLATENVQQLEFAVEKFRQAPAARAWAENHGMVPRELKVRADVVVARILSEDSFEEGTLRREKLTRDVSAVVGTRKEVPRSEPLEKAVPDASASTEEKRDAQKARSKKWGIEALEGKGEALTFPSGGPEREEDFADPVNLKYPVYTEANAANARVRFKQNADVYEQEKSKAIVHERIVRAEMKFAIEPSFDPDDPLDALLPGDLKDELSKAAPSQVTKRGELLVLKAEEGKDPSAEVRMFGIVMKPEVPDVEGDVTSQEEIRQANDRFMREFQTVGFMHKKDVSEKVKILQNVVAPTDFDFPLPDGATKKIVEGTWYQELFTDDPDLVKRVREKKLNGLSIGGFARRVPVDEEGATSEESAMEKRAIQKGEGDPAKNRFVDLRVEEVSIVDAAANEEEFFIIKRRKDMGIKKTNEQAAATEPAASVAPVTSAVTVQASASTPVETPVNHGTEATPPQPEETPEVDVQKAVQSAVESAVSKRLEGLPAIVQKAVEDGLAGVNKKLEEQGATIGKIEATRAVAKGESVPDGTAKPSEPAPVQKSMWAGSAVHNVVQRAQKRNQA
jgi:hypothetical protein